LEPVIEMKRLIIIAVSIVLAGTVIGVGVYGCKESKDYYKEGIAHRMKGEPTLAIADFTKAIEMNPRYAMAYCYRGSLFIRKAPDQAISDYSKAIEIDPLLGVAYHGRAFT
jgi:tetratricopeptide (TPR) repeat protein